MSAGERQARGLAAAYGRRQRTRARLAAWLVWQLRRWDRLRRPAEPADYLEFVPAIDDPAALADLSARINWYLAARGVPIFMAGGTRPVVRAEDAPYMDSPLVRDPGWSKRRPSGRRELVLHEFGVRSVLRYLFATRRGTVASAVFAAEAESGWFELERRYGTTDVPDAETSSARLLAHARPGAKAFVLGTGPSAALVDARAIDAEIRIACNSVVRDRELLDALSPAAIAFSDPVFHCGPSRYAAQFRADLQAALEQTGAVAVTGAHWIRPVLANAPWLRDRLAIVEPETRSTWTWPSHGDMRVRVTSNVLTLLMVPIAFALADGVEIAGCDGRNPDENYFWKHNRATQYADELMEAAFAAHPAFFRDRDYADYYAEHCAELEELLATGEAAGKFARAVTPSYIPALVERGAPSR